MTWLLDTNVCIQYLNGRSESIRVKLEAAHPSQIVMTSIVKAELYFGALRSRNKDAALRNVSEFVGYFDSIPFDDVAAEVYAAIRADLTSRGQMIGPNDLLIAAVCMSRDLTLVTHNQAEFSRIVGLKLEDWQVA